MADSESSGRAVLSGALGNLESLALAEIIQSLSLGRKTARITVTSGSRFGHIWIENGKAKHARTGRLFGEFAFYEMVRWKTGQFLLEPDVTSETRSLDHDPMYLVMEASRRIDEEESKEPATREIDDLDSAPLENPRNVTPPMKLPTETLDRETGARPGSSPPRRKIGRRVLIAGTLAPLCAVGLLLGARAMLQAEAEPEQAPSPRPRPKLVVRANPAGIPADTPDPETVPTAGEPESGTDGRDAPPARPVSEKPPAREKAPQPPPHAPTPGSDPSDLEPAAVETDVSSGPPAELSPAVVVVEQAYLRILGTSSFRTGTLVVRVDGRQVYSRTLSASEGKAKRFFKRMVGRAGEDFETLIPVEPGEHDIHAHVTVGEDAGYDSTLTLDVDPGATRDLRLIGGRVMGRPLTLEPAEPPREESRPAEVSGELAADAGREQPGDREPLDLADSLP
jgi:hypothetical protein